MAHTQINGKFYADTGFLNSIKGIPGSSVEHMGFGEFYAETPEGRVEFDRMRGVDFPGQSGRSHQVYDKAGGTKATEWLMDQMESKGKSMRVANLRSQGKSLIASDRSALIKLASTLPVGSTERKAILAGLSSVSGKTAASGGGMAEKHQIKVLMDTVRNPMKGKFLGGPSAEEAEKTLREKFNFTDKQIASLKTAASGRVASGEVNVPGKHILDNAHVSGKAQVSDSAQISDYALIEDSAKVTENSQVSGDAQVSGTVTVSDNAKVTDRAEVSGNALIYGSCVISGHARVDGNSVVYGRAKVYGDSSLRDHSMAFDEAQVSGDSVVYQNAMVSGNAQVTDVSIVYGKAHVYGMAYVFGEAQISGNARVFGKARIGGTAVIFGGNWNGSEGEITSGRWTGPGIPA